ncbi:hypothetical protein [Amycolatopsis anabasis]|uniref:nSTAND1 domain-containing NTPase n=1 Tax=Amycolatopsis anabasis TaxID=1840409 RepID=UPI001FE7A7B7|nr:hypothetical protein [Amycolatopsis anabasis]
MPRPERPLSGGDDELLRFAGDLRLLREKAGSPAYRELSRLAHYSAGTLSDAASGRRLPSLAVTLAYVRACGGDEEAWRERWHEVSAALAPPEPEHPATGSPYAGLRPFGPDDAARFHGRERLVEKITTRLGRQHFLAVVGASGSGKSSLLRAGLLPVLRAAEDRVPLLITPGAHPLQECAVHLGTLLGVTAGGLLTDFERDPRDLGLAMRQALTGDRPDTEFVLIVDQFEETFTLCQDPAERERFLAALVNAATDPGGHSRIVLGARIDFCGRFARHPDLLALLEDGQVLVGPMTTEELRRAITQPAIDAGYRVETALVSRLIADATGQPGMLPLLSHALLETWRRSRGNTLTLAGYESAGGIERAVTQTSEQVYGTLSAPQQALTKQIFLRLTALGEGTEDTKRHLARGELDRDDEDTATVLTRLADARLITLDDRGIDVAHEALIRGWPRLREWLTEDRDGLRVHRRLTEATDAWEAVDRDPGSLYRGTHLALAQDWASGHGDALSKREREFLEASSAAEAAERAAARRRTRRLRQLVALLAVLLVLALCATFYAVRAELTATAERNQALSQKVAGQATTLRTTRPATAAQLSLAAYRLEPTVEARSSLLSTFATPYATQLTNHTNNVNAAVFRPDGQLLATAAWDNTARLWDARDAHHPVELAVLTPHTANVVAVAFTPDGQVLATASWDGTVRLWDLADPRHPSELATIKAHEQEAMTVAFSPDGRLLATAGTDRAVRLWNVTDRRAPGEPAEIGGRAEEVRNVAFSPDGRVLVTGSRNDVVRFWDLAGAELRASTLSSAASAVPATSHIDTLAFNPAGNVLAVVANDRTARLWEVADPRNPTELATLSGHTDVLRAVAFSRDGRTLATASEDRTVRLWEVTDPRQPHPVVTLSGHDRVAAVGFNHDGRTLATASDDRTVRLWDLPGPILTSHAAGVCRVGFGQDGRTVITGSRDNTARLVDVGDPAGPREKARLTGHTNPVCGGTISPDGRWLVTGSWDHTMRVWDLGDPANPGAPVTFARNEDEIDAVALSPDGRVLATASDNATVRLLDFANPRDPRALVRLTGHTDDVHVLLFGPDGRLLVTTSWDRTIRLWDISDPFHPAQLAVLTGHAQAVTAAAISPDGRWLVTASPDRTTRLWNIADPRAPRESGALTGHTDAVRALAFSPDGRRLATAANDNTVRLWDFTDPAAPSESAVLTGHTDRVHAVAFGPDGRTLVTGSADNTVRIWETDVERTAARICAGTSSRITQDEWGRYFPGLPYESPCS